MGSKLTLAGVTGRPVRGLIQAAARFGRWCRFDAAGLRPRSFQDLAHLRHTWKPRCPGQHSPLSWHVERGTTAQRPSMCLKEYALGLSWSGASHLAAPPSPRPKGMSDWP